MNVIVIVVVGLLPISIWIWIEQNTHSSYKSHLCSHFGHKCVSKRVSECVWKSGLASYQQQSHLILRSAEGEPPRFFVIAVYLWDKQIIFNKKKQPFHVSRTVNSYSLNFINLFTETNLSWKCKAYIIYNKKNMEKKMNEWRRAFIKKLWIQ